MSKGELIRASDALSLSEGGGGQTNALALWNAHRWPQEQPEATPRYRTLLRRYARSIEFIFVACVALSLLATWLMPPTYRAKALVEVLAVNQDYMNNKNVDPNVSTSSMDSYLETQTKLLTTDSVMDRVTASLLTKANQYQRTQVGGLAKLEQAIGLRKTPVEAFRSAVNQTVSHVKVKAEGQSSLLSITASGPSAQLAADTANAVANQHIIALQEARYETATQTTEFLTAQLSSLRNKLRQSEDDLQAYARKTGLIFTGGSDKESVGSEKLREVQSDLEKAENDRADKQAQMELIDSSATDSLPRVVDDGTVRDSKVRLAELKRQLADLNSMYTPKHYKVKEVESQIKVLEDELKQDKGSILARLRNDYRAAVRKEALQKQEYNQQLALVTDQSSKEVGYNLLKRDVDANRDLYQSMLQKIKEANVVSALHASNVRIVDKAKAPGSPDQPNAYVNTAVGLLAGCMISVLFVLMRERADGSIRMAGQSMNLLRLPELAIVPSVPKDIRTQIVSSSRHLSERMMFKRLLSKQGASTRADLSRELVTNWRTTGSVVAESFRSAVASIILWGRDEQRSHKVLVVTSAHSSAGKTTSVLNLGLGLVESGRRVLLIDGDLRLPRLGEIFGLDSCAGLTNILAEGLHPTVASELIQDTGLPGLRILSSGTRHMNVTELLHSEALESLLEYLRSEYDFIVIDSPPALPLTDARLLAQHADGVILVVRAGATTVEQSRTVQQQFLQDGTHMIGSILNHWDASSEDPAYMTSYLKYAVASPHLAKTKVRLNIKTNSNGVGH